MTLISLSAHAEQRMRERFGQEGRRAVEHVERMVADGEYVGPGNKVSTYFYRHPDGIVLVDVGVPLVVSVFPPDWTLIKDPLDGHWWILDLPPVEPASAESLAALLERYRGRGRANPRPHSRTLEKP